MTRPVLVIVTGLPASGKTTIGRRIAAELRLPFIHRDRLKETLFDSLGWSDRDWSRRLGVASWTLLYHVAEALLASRTSFVIESNFDPGQASDELRALQRRFPFYAVQVVCVANGSVLVERYARRSQSGKRHPGHVDDVAIDEHRERLLAGDVAALDLEGLVVRLDTNDLAAIDYVWIVRELRMDLMQLENGE